MKAGREVEYFLNQEARRLVAKLNKEIEKGNDFAAFMVAIMLAMFKDFIDIVFFALKAFLTFTVFGIAMALPLVIIAWTFGLFLSLFIFFFLKGKGWFLRTRVRIYYLIFACFIGTLPGFSALPLNTILVLYSWRLVKKRARKAEEKLKSVNRMTEQGLREAEREVFSI